MLYRSFLFATTLNCALYSHYTIYGAGPNIFSRIHDITTTPIPYIQKSTNQTKFLCEKLIRVSILSPSYFWCKAGVQGDNLSLVKYWSEVSIKTQGKTNGFGSTLTKSSNWPIL